MLANRGIPFVLFLTAFLSALPSAFVCAENLSAPRLSNTGHSETSLSACYTHAGRRNSARFFSKLSSEYPFKKLRSPFASEQHQKREATRDNHVSTPQKTGAQESAKYRFIKSDIGQNELANPRLSDDSIENLKSGEEDFQNEGEGSPDDSNDTGESEEQTEEQIDEQAETGEESDEGMAATLFGERLHRAGPIHAEYIYSGGVHNNAKGGISTKKATRYRGNLDLALTLSTDDANWWNGGKVYVYFQQSHGKTLSQDFVGDAQFYNNFDSAPKPQDLTQLGEYWYEQTLADELMSIRLGRQDPNTDFAFADLGGDFINSSFVTLPNVPMPTWPTQTLGVSSLVQLSDKLRVGGGAYDHGLDIGQWWSTSVSRGMFFIGQADYQPFAGIEDSRMTLFRFGSWYTSSDTASLDGLSVFENNFGFYTTVDRMLFSEPDDAEQGLGTFFQFCWAPSDRNILDRNYGAGLVYRGLLPNRNADTIGVGFSLVEYSPVQFGLTGATAENAIEFFYKARVRNWLTLEPDLQYIAKPSGLERDALVVGFVFEATI